MLLTLVFADHEPPVPVPLILAEPIGASAGWSVRQTTAGGVPPADSLASNVIVTA